MNLSTFPFGAAPGQLPDAPEPGCDGWGSYALTLPYADRLPPFALVRPTSLYRLDCAELVAADSPATILLRLPAGALAYEKYSDGAYDYFLYYGARLPAGVLLPAGRLRLRLDGYLSAAFVACPVPPPGIRLAWTHPGPLGSLPYGTGLEQHLFLPRAYVRYVELKTTRRVSKDENDAEIIDFLALTEQGSFTAANLPPWLAQAVEAAPAHATARVDDEAVNRLQVKSEPAEDSCRFSLRITLERTQVLVRRGCATLPALPLVPEPAGGYAPHTYQCGDVNDHGPDWQPDGDTYCAQDATANWQPDGPPSCEIV